MFLLMKSLAAFAILLNNPLCSEGIVTIFKTGSLVPSNEKERFPDFRFDQN